MKTLYRVLCVIIALGLTGTAGAVSFDFHEPPAPRPQFMLVNFAEACFLSDGGHSHYHTRDLNACFGEGDEVHTYQDDATLALADQCSILNNLSRINDDESYTFSKLYDQFDGNTIASARAACAQLAHAFAQMPFDVYGKTVKSCRKMVSSMQDCVLLEGTSAGVVVGFFFYEHATDKQSQCETLKSGQAQPANLVCTWPSQRVGPDLRFRSSTDLVQCPQLPPPPVSLTCSGPVKP